MIIDPKLNEGFNLKFAWNLLNSFDSLVVLLRQVILREGKFITHHIFLSLWSRLKAELVMVIF